LMSGGRYKPVAGASPLDIIAELEELLRRLLKGLATGELSGDLRAAADEALLAEGLSAMHLDTPGVAETAEWRLPEPTPAAQLDLSATSEGNRAGAEIAAHRADEAETGPSEPATGETSETNDLRDLSVRGGEEDRRTTTRIVIDDVELPRLMGPESDHP